MNRVTNIRLALLTSVSLLAVATTWNAARAQNAATQAATAPQDGASFKDMIVAQNARRPQSPAPSEPAGTGVETVVVTAERKNENMQTVPIAMSAFTQRQLTDRQIAGGPDLIKEVPNLTFSKTNFTGYNIEIRGIGTQAISVETDPAVSVAFNGTPFIRNHFFEQEFFDVDNVEVLRGPQGTLWGRNATAGVINIISAKPTDQFEAMGSVDIGNYDGRRYEGMLNLPIVGDKLDIRLAGEWTKRSGYSTDTTTNSPIDGRDLWSGRMTIGFHPTESFHADLVWEHFNENDNRLRSGKQLCDRDNGPSEIDGISTAAGSNGDLGQEFLSQGCLPSSLYSAKAFGVPNALALPYYGGLVGAGFGLSLSSPLNDFNAFAAPYDPYASTTQSTNLRDIQSVLTPQYKAKNDTLEFNAEWHVTPRLTVSSDTGYNHDFLWSAEDYNRFNTVPGVFAYDPTTFVSGNLVTTPDGNYRCPDNTLSIGGNSCANPAYATPTGYFCDPQLGCSDRLVGEDLSEEQSWQFSQEFRLTSNFDGPFNFSLGSNYLHYQTEENYYVFFNTLTMFDAVGGEGGRQENGPPWLPGYTNASYCDPGSHQLTNPQIPTSAAGCLGYIDPNPLSRLNNQGHNYFLSQNPYSLNSYAAFGEAYYNVTKDLKLTGGLRWTDDQKQSVQIPSELLTSGYGYPSTGTINQQWGEWTGRFVASWTPDLSFTDQTMLYGSFAHGYKAGGANPPGAVLLSFAQGDIINPDHPQTFKPEFNNAFEAGTKNTALDGKLILNADVYYYDYKDYQVSQIVDRTAVNQNFNAKAWGAELQTTWSPLAGLKFGVNGGYEATRIDDGQSTIDLIDRTAGNSDWYVVKPFVTQASNCILPAYVLAYQLNPAYGANSYAITNDCGVAYNLGLDPVTGRPYVPYPTGTTIHGDPINPSYPGFNPATAPNDGEGISKPLGGNQLPNAPHITASFTAEYSMQVSPDWAATLHSDFYYQSDSWARVENDDPYDRLHGYTNLNLALTLTDDTGWQVMAYVKNVFNVTAITGDFLNSDDSGLTTNVFLNDPRLYGIRFTKHFGEGDWSQGGGIDFIPDFFADADNKRPLFWIDLGGDFNLLDDNWQKFAPPFAATMPAGLPNPATAEKPPRAGVDWEGKVAFQPEDSDWVLKAGIRYGRTGRDEALHKSLPAQTAIVTQCVLPVGCGLKTAGTRDYSDAQSHASEQHAILDFTAGKDVGLGQFTADGTSTIAGGVRMAQFTTKAMAELNADPNYVLSTKKYNSYNIYDATTKEKRQFHGIGPEATWDASQPVLGNLESGEVDIDWGLNAAVLFGRQSANINQGSSETHYGAIPAGYSNTKTIKRSRNVTVPNLGAYAGLSVNYKNAKIRFGYRADEFFGAMDGGQDTRKSEDRGFYGPYMNITIGLGG